MNDNNEFSGVDFALGSVRGFRSWKIKVEGKLEPLHRSGIWLPGENRAVCYGTPPKGVMPTIEGEDWKERNEKVKAWRLDHAFESCEHGFYAYFDASNAEGSTYGSPSLAGVIEGYGEVLIGTKGFRAMKARILAISVEPHRGIWALEPFIVDRLRRNYPGVAIFDSSFAMQAEFPAESYVESKAVLS